MFRLVVHLLPRPAAVKRPQDGGIMADRNALSGIAERNGGQRGASRRRYLPPGAASIFRTQNMTALAHGDDVFSGKFRIEQKRAYRQRCDDGCMRLTGGGRLAGQNK